MFTLTNHHRTTNSTMLTFTRTLKEHSKLKAFLKHAFRYVMRLSYLFSIQVVPCSGIDNSLICSFVRKSTWYFSLITSLSQFNTCPYAETLWRRLWPVDWIGSDSQVSIDVVVVRCCRGCFWYDGFSLIKTTTMYYFIAACNCHCHWHTHSLSLVFCCCLREPCSKTTTYAAVTWDSNVVVVCVAAGRARELR